MTNFVFSQTHHGPRFQDEGLMSIGRMIDQMSDDYRLQYLLCIRMGLEEKYGVPLDFRTWHTLLSQ